jgi:hypothetical protein
LGKFDDILVKENIPDNNAVRRAKMPKLFKKQCFPK